MTYYPPLYIKRQEESFPNEGGVGGDDEFLDEIFKRQGGEVLLEDNGDGGGDGNETAAKRQTDADISSSDDSGEDGSSDSDDEFSSDDSSEDGPSDSDDESSSSDEGFNFLMKTRRQSDGSSGDDSWKGTAERSIGVKVVPLSMVLLKVIY